MMDNRQVLHAIQPDLDDVRNDAHLLVWGDLAQWMVVDEDFLAFLRLFDGTRTLAATHRPR